MASKPLSDKALEASAVKFSQGARDNTAKRNEIVLELRGRGRSLRAIGDLVGLSHTQVGNIIKELTPEEAMA